MTIVPALCLLATMANAARDRAIEDQIRPLEKMREEAVLKHDTRTLADLYAAGMTVIDRSGELRVNTDNSAATFNAPSTRVVTRWHSEDVVVRVFGNTAIVTERAEITDVLHGSSRDFTVRLSDVWVQQNGNWKIVLRQATPVASTAKP